MCITRTPIPGISWLFPLIGHAGIGSSDGKIHDFAGPYKVNVNNPAFGDTYKYAHLLVEEPYRWD